MTAVAVSNVVSGPNELLPVDHGSMCIKRNQTVLVSGWARCRTIGVYPHIGQFIDGKTAVAVVAGCTAKN